MRRLILDAGHGGADPGATAAGPPPFREADYALERVHELATLLRVGGAWDVRLTRLAPGEELPLSKRGAISHGFGAEAVLSLHVNASDSPSAHGALFFVLPGDAASLAVAERMRDAWPAVLRNRGRFLRRSEVIVARNDPDAPEDDWMQRPINVLRPHASPGRIVVLAELGFCSNASDLAALRSHGVQQGIVAGLCAGLAHAHYLLERPRVA